MKSTKNCVKNGLKFLCYVFLLFDGFVYAIVLWSFANYFFNFFLQVINND